MAAASRNGPMGRSLRRKLEEQSRDGSGNMRFPDGDSYDGDWR